MVLSLIYFSLLKITEGGLQSLASEPDVAHSKTPTSPQLASVSLGISDPIDKIQLGVGRMEERGSMLYF